MHLVYIVKATLIERDLVRYGITEILAAGHRVSVLDISEFCHPELQHDHSKTANASGMDVHYISTESDIADKFHIMASADCAMLLIHSISCNWKSYQVLRHIQKAELPYLILKPMLFPGWNVRTDRSVSTSWISEFAKRFRTIKIQNSIFARIPSRYLRIPKATFAVHSGTENDKVQDQLTNSNTEIIHAHSFDFEAISRIAPAPIKEQAVFVDQYLPFHPDIVAANIRQRIDPEKYYTSLNKLFDRIEERYGLSVIISPHPRANYSKHPGVFAGRTISQEKTTSLINSSRLVIGHYSTALGQAVLLNRPVMLLSSSELEQLDFKYKYIFLAFARELGTKLRYFNDPYETDLEDVLDVNAERYDQFIARYLKHPDAPDMPLWETIVAAIEKSRAARSLT
tara:strand:- start:2210 stop:3406 length:1197 start_codon:yes stop_codon:yes gene_type:complete